MKRRVAQANPEVINTNERRTLVRHRRLPWPLSAFWVMLTKLTQSDLGDSFITREYSISRWEREWTHRTYPQKLWYIGVLGL